MKRPCPICSHPEVRQLYRQTFSEIHDAMPVNGYDVVVCQSCGFGYADNVPTQKKLDAYYKQLSKYENNHRAGRVSDAALSNYQKMVDGVLPFLPGKQIRIADVGCATGGLLSVFQRNGFANVMGIDPSPSCARSAADLYGLKVVTASLFDAGPFDTLFDLLVLSSVLEHVLDLADALKQMRQLLVPNGLMFIEVPDTVNFPAWASAPFQQFSVEHVNFFSPTSLSNLLSHHGFEPVAIWHDLRILGQTRDPALTALFRLSGSTSQKVIPDYETQIALENYIRTCRADDAVVLKRVDALVQSGRPILVWGTGTQTQRLLAGTNLANAHIQAFVDSNANYQGKQLKGLPILAPADLRGYSYPIVIASRVFQEEIARQIREGMQLQNEIVRLFGPP